MTVSSTSTTTTGQVLGDESKRSVNIDKNYFMCAIAYDSEHLIAGDKRGNIIKVSASEVNYGTATRSGPTSPVTAIMVQKQNFIVSGHKNGEIGLWKIEKIKDGYVDVEVNRLHQRAVRALLKLSANWFVSGADDRRIILWKLKNNELYSSKRIDTDQSCHSGAIQQFVLTCTTVSGYHFASCSTGIEIKLWSVNKKTHLVKLLGSDGQQHGNSVMGMKLIKPNHMVSFSLDGSAVYWNLENNKLTPSTYFQASRELTSLDRVSDDSVILGCYDGYAYIWNPDKEGTCQELNHTAPVIAVRSFGPFLITGGADGVVNLWQTDNASHEFYGSRKMGGLIKDFIFAADSPRNLWVQGPRELVTLRSLLAEADSHVRRGVTFSPHELPTITSWKSPRSSGKLDAKGIQQHLRKRGPSSWEVLKTEERFVSSLLLEKITEVFVEITNTLGQEKSDPKTQMQQEEKGRICMFLKVLSFQKLLLSQEMQSLML